MNDLNTIWNTFCDAVAKSIKKKNLEYEFEKGIAIDFFRALDWYSLNQGLREQYLVKFATANHYADIALFTEGQEKPEIIVELKRPKNKKKEDDTQQLKDYMKQKACSFGILMLGSCMEVYYIDYSTPDRTGYLVEVIKYQHDNRAAHELMEVLMRTQYRTDQMLDYCLGHMKINKSVDYWCSQAGKAELMNLIIERSNLPQAMLDTLRSTLAIEVKRKDGVIAIARNEDVTDTPASNDGNTDDSEASWLEYYENKEDAPTSYAVNGSDYLSARRFVLAVVTDYVNQHKNMTYSQLKEIFPDLKKCPYGVIRTSEEAKAKTSDPESRYFMKEGEVLKSSDETSFVVSTQWSWRNSPAFAMHAKKLGYDVKVAFASDDGSTSTQTNKPANSQKGILVDGERIDCFMIRAGIEARGIFDKEKKSITVKKDSIIKKDCSPKSSTALVRNRTKLAEEHTIIIKDKRKVKEDVVFDTPSAAGTFCAGTSSNGWDDWKDKNGNKLTVYRDHKVSDTL